MEDINATQHAKKLYVERLKTLNEQINEHYLIGKDILVEELREVIRKHDNLHVIAWQQYTSSEFNDGDPNYFEVHNDAYSVFLNGFNLEQERDSESMVLTAKILGLPVSDYGWIKCDDDEIPWHCSEDFPEEKGAEADKHEEAAKEVSSILNSYSEDELLAFFGETKVIVSLETLTEDGEIEY